MDGTEQNKLTLDKWDKKFLLSSPRGDYVTNFRAGWNFNGFASWDLIPGSDRNPLEIKVAIIRHVS